MARSKHSQQWCLRASCEAEEHGQRASHRWPCQVRGSGRENIAANSHLSSVTTGIAHAPSLIRNCTENVPNNQCWQCGGDGDVTALTTLTLAGMEDVTAQQPSEIKQLLCIPWEKWGVFCTRKHFPVGLLVFVVWNLF